jgi:hypothetical protein
VADAGHAKLGERQAVWLAELTDHQILRPAPSRNCPPGYAGQAGVVSRANAALRRPVAAYFAADLSHRVWS